MVVVKDLDRNVSLKRSRTGQSEYRTTSLLHKVAAHFPDQSFLRGVLACRRIEVLTKHLLPYDSKSRSYPISSVVPEVSELALVPLPGTFEYDHWLNMLEQSKPNSIGIRTLNEWTKGFSASSHELSRALHRIRVLSYHL